MNVLRSNFFVLTPRVFWNWGRLILGGSYGLGLLILIFLTWKAPELLPFLPVLLLAGVAAWYVFHHPLLNLCLILAGFSLIAVRQEGFQITEILYGLYFLGYLTHWFITRLFLYKDHIFRESEDTALFVFLLGVTLTIPISVLFGASVNNIVSEWVALIMLLIYFPIKEACVRYQKGPKAILFALAWVGIFVAVRNVLMYRQGLSDAEFAWQITTGRVSMNDHLLMAASLITFAFLSFTRRLRDSAPLIVLFLLFFIGLIFTQSRGFWVAFLFGIGVMFLMIDNQARRRIVLLGMAGLTIVLTVGLIFFRDYIALIAFGLVDRFVSLGAATSKDLSLVNRFGESVAVWDHIVQNPIVGHGMGVPYSYYDLAHQATDKEAFTHNGYFSLWYKFGIWGLSLVIFAWARITWHGFQAFWSKRTSLLVRVTGLGMATCLIASTLPTLTSNPFFLLDTTFTMGTLFGLASGAFQRSQLERVSRSV